MYIRSGHHPRRLDPKKSLLGLTVSTRFIGAKPLLLLEYTADSHSKLSGSWC